MQHLGESFYILVHEGEIRTASYDEEFLEGRAYSINNSNVDDEVREAGYDPEELTEDELAQFGFSAGFNGGHAYVEEVTIPDIDVINEEGLTEDSNVYTSEGDEFTYADLISALDISLASASMEETEDSNEDEYEEEV